MTKLENEIVIHILERGLEQHNRYLSDQETELGSCKTRMEELEVDIVKTLFNIKAIKNEIDLIKRREI